MKKFAVFLLFLLVFMPCSSAKQIIPTAIQKNTTTISASKTGELGKNYFYCQNGQKCSTEQVVREYYANSGYTVMRAEYSFWIGMFVLTFLDEFYSHTLNTDKSAFYDMEVQVASDKIVDKKCKQLKQDNLKDFINAQIKKHETGSYIRWLDEWEIDGYQNPAEYFKSPVVQDFLTKVDNKTFYKVIKKILETKGHNPLGTPDYIIWNDNEMIFVEVKREKENLSLEQIEWGEYLIKNRIPYKVVRVK